MRWKKKKNNTKSTKYCLYHFYDYAIVCARANLINASHCTCNSMSEEKLNQNNIHIFLFALLFVFFFVLFYICKVENRLRQTEEYETAAIATENSNREAAAAAAALNNSSRIELLLFSSISHGLYYVHTLCPNVTLSENECYLFYNRISLLYTLTFGIAV